MEELARGRLDRSQQLHRSPKNGRAVDAIASLHKSADHTHQASLLAQNLAQSEMARRQATALRTMMREGVERDGYRKPWLSLGRLRRLWNRNRGEAEALATVDAS